MSGNIFKLVVTVLVSLLTLTACGGGGGGETASTTVSTPTTTTSQSPNIAASQSTIDFGGVVVENSLGKTIVIQNTGDADLAVGNIIKPVSPFIITSDTCSNKTVSPSKSCSVDVTFRPTVQNTYASTVTIPSNDPDAGSVVIAINGYANGLNAWINQVDKSKCPEISFGVTVNNPKSLDSVSTLTKDNFSLYENGSAIGGFILAAPKPTPLSVVMAIDSSESIAQTKTDIASAANSFIDQLSLTDEAAVYKFNFYIDSYPDSTNFIIANDSGKTSLHNYINEPFPIQPGTRLLDAAYESINKAASGLNDKKIVIILSDGNEVSGSAAKTFEEVVAVAKQKGIPVFTVYYLGEGGNPQLLQRLAQETGGQYYDSTSTDLTTILKQVFTIVSNEYTLSYTSSLSCNGTINLGVKVNYNGLLGEDAKIFTLP